MIIFCFPVRMMGVDSLCLTKAKGDEVRQLVASNQLVVLADLKGTRILFCLSSVTSRALHMQMRN